MSREDYALRLVTPQDSLALAELFLQGFPQSVRELYREEEQARAGISDLLMFLIQACPDTFLVAETEGKILGYLVAPLRMSSLWLKALTSGFVCKLIISFVRGRYQLAWGRLPILFKNKLTLMRLPQSWQPGLAQILSVAVEPQYRGQGVGKQLLAKALELLQEKGVHGVKLEVRPENIGGLRLYQSFGFEVIGETCDSQGPWLVMQKHLK